MAEGSASHNGAWGVRGVDRASVYSRRQSWRCPAKGTTSRWAVVKSAMRLEMSLGGVHEATCPAALLW